MVIIFDGLKLVIELVWSQSMPLEFLKAVPRVREDLTNYIGILHCQGFSAIVSFLLFPPPQALILKQFQG